MIVGVHIVEEWHGDRVAARMVSGAKRARQKAAIFLLAKTIPRVPIDTGRLRNSGQAEDGVVSFNTDYAIYVHEILENHHPIGEAKFLENALIENRSTILAILGVEMKAEVSSA